MNYILFDDSAWKRLLPLTFTRPVSEIRIGILTIREKWDFSLKAKTSCHTQNYLAAKYPITFFGTSNYWINGKICPTQALVKEIKLLKVKQALVQGDTLIAFNSGKELIFPDKLDFTALGNYFDLIKSKLDFLSVNNLWEIFTLNHQAIEEDFELITRGRKSMPISATNKFSNSDRIFIEAGAKVECGILNSSLGPIYIGKNAEVMEGSLIRGPFALGQAAVLKMGTKIYGATTIGPGCKVGGEISNSVMFENSNKAHDGFLGNSVIGEWCNLGADTNNSNLKNNYGKVKIWSYELEEMVDTGLQFCGLFMGDHSKCGINTMFNTGTVVGVNSNIYGGDFPIHFIPSFSWGGVEEFVDYRIDKAIEIAEVVMSRRKIKMTKDCKEILSHIFYTTKKFRTHEE